MASANNQIVMRQKSNLREQRAGRIRIVVFAQFMIAVVGTDYVATAVALPGNAVMPSAHVPVELLTPVDVVPFAIDDIQAEPGEAVQIRAQLPSRDQLAEAETAEGAFILIRNIPAGITISSGMSTGKVWIVSLNDAGDLQLISTADTIGEFTLEFYLIGSGNKLLAKDDVAVRLAPNQAVDAVNAILDPPNKTDAETETGAVETPQPLALPPLPADEEEVLLRRAEELMQQGGIAAARLIYEELANRGSGKAALALAQTYDPAFIPPSATSAVKPDVEMALKWYERAAIYGSDEARQRIAALSAGG
jgi:hypothetical protein